MNLQELATVRELGARLTIVVMDNESLGLVGQQQDLFFAKRRVGCDYQRPSDLVALASKYPSTGVAVIGATSDRKDSVNYAKSSHLASHCFPCPPVARVPPVPVVPPDALASPVAELPPAVLVPPVTTDVVPPVGPKPPAPSAVTPPVAVLPPVDRAPPTDGSPPVAIGALPPTASAPPVAAPPLATAPPSDAAPPELDATVPSAPVAVPPLDALRWPPAPEPWLLSLEHAATFQQAARTIPGSTQRLFWHRFIAVDSLGCGR